MDILPQLLVNALIAGSIYALAASGLALTFGVLRVLNFAHGHLMMVGAYLFYFFAFASENSAGGAEGPSWWTILMAAVAAGGLLLLLAVLVLKIFVLPFLRCNVLLPLVSTLALAIILESLVAMGFGVNVKSFNVGAGSLQWGGIFITPLQILIIVSAVVLLGSAAVLVHLSPWGRRIRALAQQEFAAQCLGISKSRVSYLVFVLGTLLAGYAGVMVGYETNLQPTMGHSYTIKAFAAMILGGLGNVWGAVAGAYVLGLVENIGVGWLHVPAGYKDAFAFFVILLVLLLKPRGLFNRTLRQT